MITTHGTTPQTEADQEDQEDQEGSAGQIQAEAGAMLFGNPLQPYTPQRYVAAQGMGLLYPFVGEEGAEQVERTGLYPNIFKDVAIVLWICGVKLAADLSAEEFKAGAWTTTRAMLEPKAAKEEAFRWAEENGIFDPHGAKSAEARLAFMEIVRPVEAAKFAVNTPDGGAAPDEQKKTRQKVQSGGSSKRPSPRNRGIV